MKNKPFVFAVSGFKNSGKTTLVTKIISKLTSMGYEVASIKHDGHGFDADTPGTDSYRHREAGATLNIVYDDNKMMMVAKPMNIDKMIDMCEGYDFIILEGFKQSKYPKIEIRRSNSEESVVDPETRIALVRDTDDTTDEYISWNDIDSLIEIILKRRGIYEINRN